METGRSATLLIEQIVPDPEINARIHEKKEGIEELAENIRQLGLIHPIAVRKTAGGGMIGVPMYKIIDGERRFAALQKLQADGVINGEYIVPVLLRDDDDATASAVSLSANLLRLPLHPADQYQAFARLKREGRSVPEIAKLFSIKRKDVEKTLALGNLAPAVLDAYRKNEHVDEEVARLLTRLPDNQQMEIIGEIRKGKLHNWQIKELLDKKQLLATSPLVQFVGLKEYEKAGGQVVKDLFGGAEFCTDRKLMLELAKAKGDDLKKSILEEGWAWCEYAQDLPDNAVHNFQRIYAEEHFASAEDEKRSNEIDQRKHEIDDMDPSIADNDALNDEYAQLEEEEDAIRERMVPEYPAAKKKKAGVIIDFGSKEVILRGYIRPADIKAAKKKEKEREIKKLEKKGESVLNASALNNALKSDLEHVLTDAVGMAIATNHAQADALLIAGMLEAYRAEFRSEAPIAIGRPVRSNNETRPVFDKYLGQVVKECGVPKKDDQAMVANILEMAKGKREKLKSALIAWFLRTVSEGEQVIDIVGTDVASQWKPDEAFFNRLNRSQMFVAFKEAGISLPPETMKKGELVTFAVRELGKVGWLPPTLRSSQYKGPAKKAKQKKAA